MLNKNIIIKDNYKYYELITNETNQYYIIEKVCDSYGLQKENENIEILRKKLWKVDDFENPLKKITYYKLNDLQNICSTLNIPITKNDKKNDKKKIYFI